MIEKLNVYFGMQVNEEDFDDFDAFKGLPLYMTANRKLKKIQIAETEFLLVNILNDEKYGVTALKKQLQKYSETTGFNVVFSFSGMNKVQRNALIKANIPFISLPEQVYIPFLGILFSNKFREKKQNKNDKMMPITQQVFLYLIYNKGIRKITKSTVSKETGITKMSVTRATEQLFQMGLITQEKVGKEIFISSVEKGKQFYRLAEPFLINPIQKEIFVDKSTISYALLKSGETALGEQTMLNPPNINEFAIYKEFEDINKFRIVDKQWEDNGNIVKIQLWKYDPCIYSNNEYVDPVSLLCCFKDNEDERINIQLEEFMEEIKQWNVKI